MCGVGRLMTVVVGGEELERGWGKEREERRLIR